MREIKLDRFTTFLVNFRYEGMTYSQAREEIKQMFGEDAVYYHHKSTQDAWHFHVYQKEVSDD